MANMYVLGNWKCNGTAEDVVNFRDNFSHPEPNDDLAYGLALPYHLLHLADHFGNMFLGGQDVSTFGPGAFTGEISAEMLKDAGCAFSLVGHSERRQYFGETVKTTATDTTDAAIKS